MTRQYLLDGGTQTVVDDERDLDTTRGLFGAATVADGKQQRSYEWSLSEWTKMTVAWIWHNDRLQSKKSQDRYWQVWLDCFGGTANRFEYMPMSNDIERAMRITSIIHAAAVKPWEFDARHATQYKINLENRWHTTGKAERRGKKGTVLQRDTRQEKPLSPKSIGNALAVLSSYYKKASRYPIYKDGVEVPLFERTNPFNSIERPRFEVMFVREGLTMDEINRVLSVIPIETVIGSMHYALILAYSLTGRRNSEIRTAKYGDFKIDAAGAVWQTWRGKHHVDGKCDQVHPDVWAAINLYLQISGRLDTIQADDYIFTATKSNAKRSQFVKDTWQPGVSPLTAGEVWRVVQLYLRKARVKGNYTVHSFRHALAEQMLEEGARIDEVQRQLGHRNIATTLIYSQKKKQGMSDAIDRVSDKIGSHRLLSNRQQMV